MEEAVALLVGIGALILSPMLAPGLRPVAKSVIKGGLAVTAAAAGVVAITGEKISEIATHVKSDVAGGQSAESALAEPAAVDTAVVTAAASAAAAAPIAETEAAQVTEEPVQVEVAPAEAPIAQPIRFEQEPLEPAAAPVAGDAAETITPVRDDLRKIKGIGPKTAGVLEESGITTYQQIAAMNPAQLREILAKGGSRMQLINPETWPEEARRLLEA
jgi:predicted flap endonuclease-1-like 5' DNA nuclease